MKKEKITHWHYKTEIILSVAEDNSCPCPVCGKKTDNIEWRPYDEDGNPTYDICECCFFEFGYDDGGDEPPHNISWENYRVKWLRGEIENATKLTLTQKREQLKNIGVNVENGL